MKTAQKEKWQQVADCPDYYVSTLGRVKSIKTRSTKFRGIPHTLKPTSDPKGYYRVSLYNEGIQRVIKIHRLILITFRGQPQENQEANHINGIKHDNRLDNLEWVTKKQNSQHAYVSGLGYNPKGEKARNAKLTNSNVRQIKRLLKQQISQRKIASQFNISPKTISDIRTGRTWSHLR